MNVRPSTTGRRGVAATFVVGLTGDVGAGKSTLADVWQGQGAHIVNADRIAKEQWKKEDIVEAEEQGFG